ncbi:Eef2k [Scenedesmus sp. PABB004]|nr:Eef2k [Scenedesmus sp. PABB004]
MAAHADLSALLGDQQPPSLAALEALQAQLHGLIVQHHGAAAAAGVLGRALAGLLPGQATAPAAAAKPVPPPGQAAPPANEGSSLGRSSSAASELSDSGSQAASDASSRSRQRWQRAVAHVLARTTADPWASRRLHALPMEVAVRHRYTAAGRHWVKDTVLVRMEGRPFAAGAMRECYALKKLSTFSSSVARDWRQAHNFVAKRYKRPVDRGVYFADVVLQMDAKYLGDAYSKIPGVPKKVDFVQAALLEMRDRPGRPVLAVERLIEGAYVKYNSNSGYVAAPPLPGPDAAADAAAGAAAAAGAEGGGGGGGGALLHSPSTVAAELALRHTPQTFSHFTFEFTKGAALCVDIQGVGDLYTDPQIHTLDGTGYGDGNLALRGMALFFRTHECNPLCGELGLRPFARCAQDVAAQGYASAGSSSDASGTLFRSFGRHTSVADRLLAQRAAAATRGPVHGTDALLAALERVPAAPEPDALVHWEVARLYAETVTLPELRPNEDPDDARVGGLFHLLTAAARGVALAQLVLACGHMGLQPNSTQLAHLLTEARRSGDFTPAPRLALRYTQLAAERGVLGAAAALGHAYATGGGVGEGLLTRPYPAHAARWLRVALGQPPDGGGGGDGEDEFGALPDGLNPRSGGGARRGGTATPPRGGTATPPRGGGGAPSPAPALRRGGAGCVSFRAAPAGSPCALGDDGVAVGSLFTLADQLSAAATAALAAARGVFDDAAAEEARLLPGGGRARHELLAELAELLLAGGAGPEPADPGAAEAGGGGSEGGGAPDSGTAPALLPGLAPDAAAAAALFTEAAEAAAAAGRGKASAALWERAAAAEAAADDAHAAAVLAREPKAVTPHGELPLCSAQRTADGTWRWGDEAALLAWERSQGAAAAAGVERCTGLESSAAAPRCWAGDGSVYSGRVFAELSCFSEAPNCWTNPDGTEACVGR